MTSDQEFDSYLNRALEETPLPDENFSRIVTARLAGHRRRRRAVLAGGWAVAAALAGLAASASSSAVTTLGIATPQTMVTALLLITACSFVWIDTEARSHRTT